MDAFAKMDKLTHLYLVKLKINDLTPVSQLPELKTICPVGTDIADIECPGKLEMPESVEIYGYGNKYVINQATQNLSNLQRLTVTDDIPDDRGFTGFECSYTPLLRYSKELCGRCR